MLQDVETCSPSYPFDQGKSGEDLHPLYGALGPGVHRVRMVQAGLDAFMVTDYALLRQVFEDEATFRPLEENIPGIPPVQGTLLGMWGSDHRRVRRPAVASFTAHAVRERLPGIGAQVAGRLEALAARGRPVDLVSEFAFPLTLAVLGETLGVPEDDRHLFADWGDRYVDLTDLGEAERAAREMCAYIAEALERRRAAGPASDLLSRYVHTEHGLRVSGEEAAMVGMAVIVAGWESTAGLITSMVHYLLTHLDQWERLVADPALADNAVHELLRTRAAGSDDGPARRTTRDVVLGGVEIPAGTIVLVAKDAANRDAARFPDPDAVDLARPDADENLSFGAGPHVCLGRNLGVAVLRCVLSELAARHPGARLTGEPVTWQEGSGVRRPERLMVTLV
ncbi:cytochrome P450 [Actinocorallia populi]|uniref:cytochrome P450 n=1 Tax=Actinocorallia populi TaxID=2079200 RepID=UPI0013003A13|nr:cytochrome P450 [Actinocorallia populi]